MKVTLTIQTNKRRRELYAETVNESDPQPGYACAAGLDPENAAYRKAGMVTLQPVAASLQLSPRNGCREDQRDSTSQPAPAEDETIDAAPHCDWPFPSVAYDYARAGVGTVHREIEIDREEVGQTTDQSVNLEVVRSLLVEGLRSLGSARFDD